MRIGRLDRIKQQFIFRIATIRLYKEIFKEDGVRLILLQKTKKQKN